MSEDTIGISQSASETARSKANEIMPLLQANLKGDAKVKIITDAQKANVEIVYGKTRASADVETLACIRLFARAGCKVEKLDSSSETMFASMIGGMTKGDILPSSYALYYGAGGFSQTYREARVSKAKKFEKAIQKLQKPWTQERRDGYWDDALKVAQDLYEVVEITVELAKTG